MEALDHKCPSCGAPIKFNPNNQLWDCEYCGQKYSLEDMQKYVNGSINFWYMMPLINRDFSLPSTKNGEANSERNSSWFRIRLLPSWNTNFLTKTAMKLM